MTSSMLIYWLELQFIKLGLSTELGVEGCGSDYNPVVQ